MLRNIQLNRWTCHLRINGQQNDRDALLERQKKDKQREIKQQFLVMFE